MVIVLRAARFAKRNPGPPKGEIHAVGGSGIDAAQVVSHDTTPVYRNVPPVHVATAPIMRLEGVAPSGGGRGLIGGVK